MTAAELLSACGPQPPDAEVMFLPFGADEDELEDVGVVEVFSAPWTIDRRYRDANHGAGAILPVGEIVSVETEIFGRQVLHN